MSVGYISAFYASFSQFFSLFVLALPESVQFQNTSNSFLNSNRHYGNIDINLDDEQKNHVLKEQLVNLKYQENNLNTQINDSRFCKNECTVITNNLSYKKNLCRYLCPDLLRSEMNINGILEENFAPKFILFVISIFLFSYGILISIKYHQYQRSSESLLL